MEMHTPQQESHSSTGDVISKSPTMGDTMLFPWNWGEEARNVHLSPGSSCSSPEYRESSMASIHTGIGPSSGGSESRRGRPRADALTNLMMQGSTSPSSIKCRYCNRVFPREKSLQAHLRTHTGERPYPCDYPGCTKAFTQSGQLKTHQRLHTVSGNTEMPHDVTRWLERYKMAREREDRTPSGKDRKKKQWKSNSENLKRLKSRKGLMMDSAGEQENLDHNSSSQRVYCSESQDSQEDSQDDEATEACTPSQHSEDDESPSTSKLPSTPVRRMLDRLQPKKRWLREACLEQQLAKPLRWDSQVMNESLNYVNGSNINNRQITNHLNPASWNVSCVRNLAVDVNFDEIDNNIPKQLDNIDSSIRIPSTTAEWDICTSTFDESSQIDINVAKGMMFDDRNTESRVQWNSIQSSGCDVDESIPLMEKFFASDENGSDIGSSLGWKNEIIDDNHLMKHNHIDKTTVTRHVENKMRPTVLMLAGSSTNNISKEHMCSNLTNVDGESGAKVVVVKQEENMVNLPLPEDNQKWLGALALMELAKTQEEAAKASSAHVDNFEQQDVGYNYTHL
ncbi:hypothetical protein PV327_008182 [Microctonus hyperodae]|uniref:C2H2-type domain-containing protein n=1 Tax=Microctonus hyperodae TaxID=165561 RepID=A0AA39F2L5_MICHY|nr:hypothetical protein PV327_008182 [Microctonus hyperodae]